MGLLVYDGARLMRNFSKEQTEPDNLSESKRLESVPVKCGYFPSRAEGIGLEVDTMPFRMSRSLVLSWSDIAWRGTRPTKCKNIPNVTEWQTSHSLTDVPLEARG